MLPGRTQDFAKRGGGNLSNKSSHFGPRAKVVLRAAFWPAHVSKNLKYRGFYETIIKIIFLSSQEIDQLFYRLLIVT